MSNKSLKQHLLLNNSSVAIIGAGASGLLSAIILGRAKFNVTVFERNTKVGRKILTTGNGKCNISNINVSSLNYYCHDNTLINHVLKQFNFKKCQELFEELGLDFYIQEDGKAYPQTLQASSVVDVLYYEAKRVGVTFVLNTTIENINYQDNKFTFSSEDNIQSFDKLIVATGSKAMPKLGSCDIGYNIAKDFGHDIVEPFASLVQLVSDNIHIKELSGVKINAKITLEIDKEHIQTRQGDLLFTNYGLSGNTILDISRDSSYALSIGSLVTVKLDIFPQFNKDVLISKLTKRVKNSYNKDKYFWLEGFLHKKLIRYIIDNCGLRNGIVTANEINKKDIMTIVHFMKNIKINIIDTKGFDTAEVCAGGVNIYEIKTKSLESTIQKELYFVGEVLDIDGQCGGYNLHWAWASAFVCANNIVNHRR